MDKAITIYFLMVNIVGGALFAYDKRVAIRHKPRIAERTLHLLELCGGIFSVLILMHILPHKNRKPSYYVLSYFILAGWGVLLYYLLWRAPLA